MNFIKIVSEENGEQLIRISSSRGATQTKSKKHFFLKKIKFYLQSIRNSLTFRCNVWMHQTDIFQMCETASDCMRTKIFFDKNIRTGNKFLG